MPKMICQGGQTRKVDCKCGFHASGSIREVNMRLKLHMKKCDHNCIIPEYNKATAKINGELKCMNSKMRHGFSITENVFNDKIIINEDLMTEFFESDIDSSPTPPKAPNTISIPTRTTYSV